MDPEARRRVARALEAALSVYRDAKGRLSASDIRVQSLISAVRSGLIEESEPLLFDWPMVPPSRPPFDVPRQPRSPEQRH